MTIQLEPVQEDPNLTLAKELVSALKAAYQMVKLAQTGNSNNSYGSLVNIPAHNKVLQDQIAAVQATGQVSTVLAFVDSHKLLPSGFAITDAQNFASALDSLATDIEMNAELFLLSMNSVSKVVQFNTPVNETVKTTIDTRITAVLAEAT